MLEYNYILINLQKLATPRVRDQQCEKIHDEIYLNFSISYPDTDEASTEIS